MARLLVTATIPTGQAVSNAVDLADFPIVGLYVPSTWDTTTELTFVASHDSVTWYEVDNSTKDPWRLQPNPGSFVPVVQLELEGIRFMKLRAGTKDAPINQGADRVLKLVLRQE